MKENAITEVKDAFNGLLTDAKDLLGFIHDTVEPDYSSFVDVAQQYGNDAETITQTYHVHPGRCNLLCRSRGICFA